MSATRHRTPAASFAARTERRGDCLIWMGYTDRWGYGRISVHGDMVLAHRWAYEQVNGPIPDGMEIDHICHTPACVEASHLRAVTSAQNSWNLAGAHCDSEVPIRGLSRKDYGRWDARVSRQGRTVRRSFPASKKAEAIAWLAEKRKEMFGDYAGI